MRSQFRLRRLRASAVAIVVLCCAAALFAAGIESNWTRVQFNGLTVG